jgi:hypothetical protein
LPPWLRPMAARTGAAPVSLPRQGSCDAGRITSRSLLARSRTESSRLGNASLGIRQDEESVAKTFRSWRRREHSLLEVRIASRGVTYGCCLRRRPIHSRPGSLAPSRHSRWCVNRTREVRHPKPMHYHCANHRSERRESNTRSPGPEPGALPLGDTPVHRRRIGRRSARLQRAATTRLALGALSDRRISNAGRPESLKLDALVGVTPAGIEPVRSGVENPATPPGEKAPSASSPGFEPGFTGREPVDLSRWSMRTMEPSPRVELGHDRYE